MFGGNRPDNCGTVAWLHRQQRERPAGIENLIGGIGVRHFMFDCRYHTDMLIGPSRDAHTSGIAGRAIATFRSHQKRAGQLRAAGQRHCDAVGITVHGDSAVRLKQRKAIGFLGCVAQGDTKLTIFEHDAHRAIAFGRHEIECARFQAIADPNAFNRAAFPFHLRADPDGRKHVPRRTGNRRDSSIETGSDGSICIRGIDDCAGHAMPG